MNKAQRLALLREQSDQNDLVSLAAMLTRVWQKRAGKYKFLIVYNLEFLNFRYFFLI
jgi:hypothetical protein